MKKMLGLLAVAVLATGCATSGSVKEAIAPLNDRIAKLEQQRNATQAKLADMSSKEDAQSADLQAVRKELADAKNSGAGVQQAAADARASADRAEQAAAKATKAFELSQRRGGK